MPWELIISDASDQPVQNEWGTHVRILDERPRQGFVKGYNRAFQETTGTWVIWLNDDAEAQPGYAETAVQFMEAHPDIGLGAFYYAEGQLPYRVYKCYGDVLYANFGIISRELGNQVGWFDEHLTMYGSDNSLAFRVLMAGKGVAAIPNALIWHHVENDVHKLANQKYRIPDGRALHANYRDHMRRIRTVHRTFAKFSGPEIHP